MWFAMTTGVIILNFNNADATIHCICSLEKYNTRPVKYIIIDNGSAAESVERLDAFFKPHFEGDYLKADIEDRPDQVSLPKVSFLLNPWNEGYAVGNNKGLAWAYSDDEITRILLVNNDILFTEDILPRLEEDMQSLPGVGIITPLLLQKDGKTVDSCCARRFVSNRNLMVPFLLHNRDIFGWITKHSRKQHIIGTNPELLDAGTAFPIDYPSGSALYFKKSTFFDIDGFDNRTFLYYEELILYKKLKGKGLRSYCDPTIQAIHLGGDSTRMSDNSFLQRCNLESADVYFRNYGEMTPTERIAWAVIRKSWEARLWLKKQIRRSSR